MEYTGKPNPSLDRDFDEAEIWAALQKLNSKSAPGPDGVTNKALRNLDKETISELTKYINECWTRGSIPDQWKRAKMVLIPKPGKPPNLDNLRPISLTSCVGKLMEHAFLSRINAHLDDIEAYPDTMLGFRAHLSTQDAMLQIKHQVLDNKTRGTRAILGLDLKKAFDNAAHAAILRKMAALNLGKRAYNYVKDFLTNRSVSLTLGKLASEDRSMGSVGTPQGSVISPMLFNLVMIGLPERLNAIEGVHHAITQTTLRFGYAREATEKSSSGYRPRLR